MVIGSSFCIIINVLTSYLYDYDIKKSIVMQKFEPIPVSLKPIKIRHVDRV